MKTIEADKLFLSFGFRRVAKVSHNMLDEYSKKALEAFAEGVNAYVAGTAVLPAEFLLTGAKFEKWEVMDSLTIGMFSSLQVSPYWVITALRSAVAKQLGKGLANKLLQPFERFNAFDTFPPVVSEEQLRLHGLYVSQPEPVPLRKRTQEEKAKEFKKPAREGPQPEPISLDVGGGHSNAWVIHGNHTKSGKPLLASDPHVASTQPSMFYGVNFKLRENTVAGYVLPGTPMMLFGRTSYASWGMTSSYVENTDLYELKLDLKAAKYFHDGKWKDLTVHRNVIRPKGAQEFVFLTYETHHGAVLFPVSKAVGLGLPEP